MEPNCSETLNAICEMCEKHAKEDLRRMEVANRRATLEALIVGLSLVGITAFLCWIILS